jgi:hypothetical protein
MTSQTSGARCESSHWPRVPKKLRDEMDRETLYRHLDIAAWEVIKQRMAQVTPLEALVRGLDGELWNSPV